MLVDDEPDLLNMVSGFLEDDGFTNVVTASMDGLSDEMRERLRAMEYGRCS